MADNTIPENPNISKTEALRIIQTFTWAYDHTDNDERIYHGSNRTYECILYAKETLYHQHIASQLHMSYKGDMLCGKLNIPEYDDQNQSCIEIWDIIPHQEKYKVDKPYDGEIKEEIVEEPPTRKRKSRDKKHKKQTRKEYNDILRKLKDGQICVKWPSIRSAISSVFIMNKDDETFLSLVAWIIQKTNEYDNDRFKMSMKRRSRNSEIIFEYDCGNISLEYNTIS